MKKAFKSKIKVKILKPDVIFRPAPKIASTALIKPVLRAKARMIRAGVLGVEMPAAVVPEAKKARMMLKSVQVKDNKELLGTAQVYVLTVVTDDVSSKPFCIALKTFDGVANKDYLPFGPAGVAIYRSPRNSTPTFLDYRILVMVSHERIRNAGKVLADILDDESYKSLMNEVSLVVAAGNAPAAFIIKAADSVLGIIAKLMKAEQDKQVIYIVGSFDQAFDQLGIRYNVIEQETRGAKVSYQVQKEE